MVAHTSPPAVLADFMIPAYLASMEALTDILRLDEFSDFLQVLVWAFVAGMGWELVRRWRHRLRDDPTDD